MKTIVVGVDGSKCSQAALEFAAEEAAFRGARLLVVSAREVPQSAVLVAGAAPGIIDSFREEAETIVREAVARATRLQPSVSCESRVIEGHPGHVLLEQARRMNQEIHGQLSGDRPSDCSTAPGTAPGRTSACTGRRISSKKRAYGSMVLVLISGGASN